MQNKICFFINDISNSGGTERVTTVVANALADRGYDVSILTINSKNKPFFALNERVKCSSLDVTFGSFRVFSRIKIIIELKKYLSNNNINTIITVDSLLSIYSLPATIFSSVRNICWEHFNFDIDLGVKMRRFSRYCAGVLADDIVVLSNRDKKNGWLNQYFRRTKFTPFTIPPHILFLPKPIILTLNMFFVPEDCVNKKDSIFYSQHGSQFQSNTQIGDYVLLEMGVSVTIFKN